MRCILFTLLRAEISLPTCHFSAHKHIFCKHRLTASSVYITSDAFKSKMQPARHRLVYGLLKDEMAAEGGIHALQLRTRTVAEEERAQAQAQAATEENNA